MVGWQDGMNGAPGEFAMSDLTSLWSAHATGLAHGEGRKVVVQQEVLFVGSLQGIDKLLVFASAKRGNHQRLGFAAGEKRRTVRPRQDAGLAYDGSDRLHVAAVDALSGVEDVPAHDLG